VLWRSPGGIALDLAAIVLMIAGTALVGGELCRRIRERRFSLADLGWAILMAGLAARFVGYGGHRPDLISLLGGNLDGPRIATLAWYPWWLRIGLCCGSVCGAVLILHSLGAIARWMLPAARLNVKSARWAPPC
jgi:hypothetical protein